MTVPFTVGPPDDLPPANLAAAWQLLDTARAGGECGQVVEVADSLYLLCGLRACHLPVSHAGPHASRWRGQLIAWDADATNGPTALRQLHLEARPWPRTPSEPTEESPGAFLRRLGVDTALWAQEFAKAFGGDPTPGNTLHGWVCNMVEAGRSAGYWEARRQRAQGDALPAEVFHELEATAAAVTRDILRPGLAAAGVDNPDQYHVEVEVTPFRLQPSPDAGNDTSSVPAGATPPAAPFCAARTVFWPDDEQIDVACKLLAGHLGDHCEENGGTWSRDTDGPDVPDQHGDPVAAWALFQLSDYEGNPWSTRDVAGELRQLRDTPGAWVALIGRRTVGDRDHRDMLARELRRWLDSAEGREQFALPSAPVLDRVGLLSAWAPATSVVVMGVSQFDARHHGELLTRMRPGPVVALDRIPSGPVYRSGVAQALQTLRGTTGAILAVTPIALVDIIEQRRGRLRGPVDGELGEALAAARVAGVYACFPPVD